MTQNLQCIIYNKLRKAKMQFAQERNSILLKKDYMIYNIPMYVHLTIASN
jgi:hypothetical protein